MGADAGETCRYKTLIASKARHVPAVRRCGGSKPDTPISQVLWCPMIISLVYVGMRGVDCRWRTEAVIRFKFQPFVLPGYFVCVLTYSYCYGRKRYHHCNACSFFTFKSGTQAGQADHIGRLVAAASRGGADGRGSVRPQRGQLSKGASRLSFL